MNIFYQLMKIFRNNVLVKTVFQNSIKIKLQSKKQAFLVLDHHSLKKRENLKENFEENKIRSFLFRTGVLNKTNDFFNLQICF